MSSTAENLHRVSEKYLPHLLSYNNLCEKFSNNEIFSEMIMDISKIFIMSFRTHNFTEIRATHDFQNVGFLDNFCFETGGIWYLVQRNQVRHSDPTKLSPKASKSFTFSHLHLKMGSKPSRQWYCENSK